MGRAPIPRYGLALIALATLALLAYGGHGLGAYVGAIVDAREAAQAALLDGRLIWVVLAIYLVLIALPFVPGAELGIGLLLLLGPEAAGPVYLATVAALTLSFTAGRLVPEARLHGLAVRLGLPRVARLLEESRTLTSGARAQLLIGRLPTRWLPWLVRHRLVSLAVLINTPGNMILGGGGGIALAAGVSRLLSYREFLLSVSLAVAPVPAAVIFAAWIRG